MTSPFSHPEAAELFTTLLVSLTAESDRGAVLVGAAHVDNSFRSLFEAVFPKETSKKGQEQLLNLLGHSGVLGTLSSRVEVAYALRLIPRSIRNSTNALRKIRNDAAHKPEDFQLAKHEQRISRIYSPMGETLPKGLRALAMEMMFSNKSHALLEMIRKEKEKDPDFAIDVTNKDEALLFIADRPEVLSSMDRELPRWQLAIGVALLCSLIIAQRDKVCAVVGTNTLISTLGSGA